MARTVIDLDNALVEEEVLDNRRGALALTRLREAAADGAVDLTLLEDKRNYRS
jgi:hypothetical protein